MNISDDVNAAAEFRHEEERVEREVLSSRKNWAHRSGAHPDPVHRGLPWIGVAQAGPSHVVLWLLAMVLFYIPSAVVVTYLNRIMPLEGGLYQWAKLGFNELTGFLVAWNLWLFAILNTSEIGLQITQYVRYIIGPSGEWLTGSKWFIGAVSLAIIGALVLLTTVGLGVGKWVHKAGGVADARYVCRDLILPWLNLANGSLPAYHPLKTEMPVLSHNESEPAGQDGIRRAGRDLSTSRSTQANAATRCGPSADLCLLAAPVIAVMFILGTSSMLALIAQDQIDLIAPIPQVLSEGLRPLGIRAAAIASTTILALAVHPDGSIERDVRGQHPAARWSRVGTVCSRIGSRDSMPNTRRLSIRFCSWEPRRSRWGSWA